MNHHAYVIGAMMQPTTTNVHTASVAMGKLNGSK